MNNTTPEPLPKPAAPEPSEREKFEKWLDAYRGDTEPPSAWEAWQWRAVLASVTGSEQERT